MLLNTEAAAVPSGNSLLTTIGWGLGAPKQPTIT
jgi:hypothetical protein